MGNICSSSTEDPESSPAAYIDYDNKMQRMYAERLEGKQEKVNIGRDAFDLLWYDIEDYLWPIEEEEEELRVEDMNAE